MKKKTKQRREPLLYLHQPNFQESEVNMQSVYSSKNSNTLPIHKKSKSGKKEKETEHFALTEVMNEKIDTEMADSTTEKISPFQPVKPFKDMTVEEKLQHLNRFKNGRAPFPCEFVTLDQSHRGVLVKYEGNTIEIKPFQGENIVCKRSDLSAIHLIGLS
ncbi:CotO family spore coat protein [Bacillus sp. 2205SS5-2]|uniref:CotO family spore coat protein n=1 Tax=Bacillus sp. 2205SS5-2 TaxID=3109031 RepID=UPI00300517AA